MATTAEHVTSSAQQEKHQRSMQHVYHVVGLAVAATVLFFVLAVGSSGGSGSGVVLCSSKQTTNPLQLRSPVGEPAEIVKTQQLPLKNLFPCCICCCGGEC